MSFIHSSIYPSIHLSTIYSLLRLSNIVHVIVYYKQNFTSNHSFFYSFIHPFIHQIVIFSSLQPNHRHLLLHSADQLYLGLLSMQKNSTESHSNVKGNSFNGYYGNDNNVISGLGKAEGIVPQWKVLKVCNIYVHVCMYVCTCMYVCMYVYVYVYMYVCMVYICVCVFVYMYVCMYVCVYVC